MSDINSLLKSLDNYSSCDVGDALRALGVTGGYLSGLKARTSVQSPKLIGRAYTVELVDVKDKESEAYKNELHWMDTVGEGQVVVIKAPLNLPNAVFGGLMGARAVKLGALGAVISGNIRDTRELEELGLKIYSHGTSSLGAKNFSRPSKVNQTLVISPPPGIDYEPTEVNPNDVVIADEDGVCIVPFNLLSQVLEQCEKSTKVDGKCLADIQSGKSIAEAFATHR